MAVTSQRGAPSVQPRHATSVQVAADERLLDRGWNAGHLAVIRLTVDLICVCLGGNIKDGCLW